MNQTTKPGRHAGKEYAALIVDLIDFQRREQNMSRAELARRAGIPASTLRRILDGRSRLTMTRWAALADALNTSPWLQVDQVEDMLHARYWPVPVAI